MGVTSTMHTHTFSNRTFGPMLSTESGGAAVLDRPDNAAAIDDVLANAPNEYLGDAGEQPDQPEQPAAIVPEVVEAGVTFADLGLSPALLESVLSVGYEVPTPIQ